MKKILKWIGIILIVLLVIGIFSGSDENSSSDSSSESKNEQSKVTINFPEFINQTDDYFLEKLGEPEGGASYEDPKELNTQWIWKKDGYTLSIDFTKGEKVKYISAEFQGECDQKTDKYLKKVGLEYPSDEPIIARDGNLYRWESYSDEYARLNIYCEDESVNIVLISEIYKL